MPPTDAEIIRHLAEKVMGWKWHRSIRRWMEMEEGDMAITAQEDWNPLESIADCMEVQEKVLAGPHRTGYIDRMYGEALDGSNHMLPANKIFGFLLSAPARVRVLAMYRATGGAE